MGGANDGLAFYHAEGTKFHFVGRTILWQDWFVKLFTDLPRRGLYVCIWMKIL